MKTRIDAQLASDKFPVSDISLNQPKHPIFQACGGTHAVVQDADSLPEAPVRASRGGGYSIPPAGINFDAPSSQERSGSDDGAPAQGQVAGDVGLSLSDWGIRSTIQHPRGASIHFVKRFSSSSGLKSRNPQNSLNFFSNSGVSWRSLLFGRIATYWAELMRRTLAPLRKIVARELEVFELRRNSVHPQSFAVHDRLECGHTHTSLLWDIFDLLNAYTESPHVRAIRHRCQECLTLTQRKPVQSVAAVAKAA